jgi:integrase/recombinase XerD
MFWENREEFLEWLMKRNPGSAHAYINVLDMFFRRFNEFNEENVKKFLEQAKVKEETRYNYKTALNSYRKFLGEKGVLPKVEELPRDPEIESLIEEIARLMQGKYAQHTIKQTKEHSRRWLLFLKRRGKKAEEATQYDAELFLSEISSGKKRNSLVSYVDSLRRFYNLLRVAKGINNNPFLLIKIKPEKPLPRYLEREEIEKLKEEAKKIGEREYALICLLYSSGIRVGEACNLTWGDVDLRGRKLYIRSSKTGEGRIAYFNEETAIALGRWKLKTAWANKNDRVFLTRNPHYLTRIVKEIGKIAGVEVTPHRLRHSLGTHLVRAGVELRIVQEILGHKDIRNTQIYTKLSQKDVEKAYREFWRE